MWYPWLNFFSSFKENKRKNLLAVLLEYLVKSLLVIFALVTKRQFQKRKLITAENKTMKTIPIGYQNQGTENYSTAQLHLEFLFTAWVFSFIVSSFKRQSHDKSTNLVTY